MDWSIGGLVDRWTGGSVDRWTEGLYTCSGEGCVVEFRGGRVKRRIESLIGSGPDRYF